MFLPHFWTRKKDCRDDSLLRAIVDEFAAEGIRFAPATDYAPELLVGQGQLTRRGPTAWQQKDIEFGWKMAKEMGRLDIGQSVAVKDQAVLAVEAVEGTDECIRRAGELCRAGGFTVVKVAKPQQDMRFDVPTIGLRHAGNAPRRRRQGVGRRGRPHDLSRPGGGDRVCRPSRAGDRRRCNTVVLLHKTYHRDTEKENKITQGNT